MRRVILVGKGESTERLRQLLQNAGAEVVVIASDKSICGKECAKINVDDLCAQIDDAMLYRSPMGGNPVGLLRSTQMPPARGRQELSSAIGGFDPRCYLKRKKGRTTTSGRRIGATLNNVAKRSNRA